uniref:Uncharacterized protein n=1 Tax=viral metagenome TaxID=1070528 RepID=A0A6M3IPP5_9ZZZZ
MFFSKNNAIHRYVRKIRLSKIAREVRAGNVPRGTSFETICEALKSTKKGGAVEMFGILSAKQNDAQGNFKKDLGVVGVKAVTLEFAKLLADSLGAYAASTITTFNAHAQGDGSAAEGTGDAALSSQRGGRNVGSQTHGASSNIYKSVATIAATASYTVIEHGLFDTTGAASDRLLDRTVIDSFVVATNDEVEWTYQLTIVTGG